MESNRSGRTNIVAGSKPWNRKVFDEIITKYPGRWHFLGLPEELTLEAMRQLSPRYVFFLHWSWKVPQEIIDAYECICFHMTDVPYGRGGSPLQNLIARGQRRTKLAALRMTQDFDAGPVYLKEDLCLEGNAEEIYIRASYLSARMVRSIIAEHIEPLPQTGEVVVWKRRKPHESEVPAQISLCQLFDFIRMLDAQDYPKAFIEGKGFRFEFRRAALYDGRIVADVTITHSKETGQS
jgi:methionyl-tRNA formyltransferase